MDSILEGLNDPQKQAVTATEGPLLVLAGAGSGKTRVITHRFAYILDQNKASINNILAVTFTNKAAGEMKERIGGLLGMDTAGAWVRTFHSTGALLMRRHPEAFGYPRDFVIYDDDDSKKLVKSVIKELNIDASAYNANSIHHTVLNAKENMLTPEEQLENATSELEKVSARIYRGYQDALQRNKAVDFTDLITIPLKMFRENPRILGYYQNQWRYIMVDEFQDTNFVQYELIKLICSEHRNVCVVGDDDQSIYGWRGATVENLYDFEKTYEPMIVPLEQNYRSTKTILEAANQVVSRIPGRMSKKLWTDRKSDQRIKLIQSDSESAESRRIVEQIIQLSKQYSYKDFAVFYRTNAQSRSLEEAFLSYRIPARVIGGQKFFERMEIKDILAYLRCIANPFDRIAFERVLSAPARGIGDTTRNKLIAFADANGLHMIEALLRTQELDNVRGATTKACKELGEILLEMNQSLEKLSPVNFVKILIDVIGYKTYITNYDETGKERWENVEQLINGITEFQKRNGGGNIIDYLNEVSLQTSTDELDAEEKRNSVSLMTIHNAKGLEFPVVFISGTVDGLIPLSNSVNSQREIDEERRVFYVAITRAKDILFITYPFMRYTYGETTMARPSPFLDDIDPGLVEHLFPPTESQPKAAASRELLEKQEKKIEIDRKKSIAAIKGMKISGLKDLEVGDTVKHPFFGIGKVQFVSERLLEIAFDEFGKRQFGGSMVSGLEKVIV